MFGKSLIEQKSFKSGFKNGPKIADEFAAESSSEFFFRFVLQGAAGTSAVCAYRTDVLESGRAAAGRHVPEGETATAQVQDADEAADGPCRERPGTFRVSSGASWRPRHVGRMVQGRRSVETRSVRLIRN